MIRALFSEDSTIAKLFRYGLAGGTSSLFYGICAWCFVHPLSLPPVTASITAYLLAIPVSYIMQRQFAFRSRGSVYAEAPRFLVVHGINIATSIVVMYATADVLQLNPSIGVAATMILIPLFSFVVMNLWVFPRSRSRDNH